VADNEVCFTRKQKLACPVRVKSGHDALKSRCPHYPQKRTLPDDTWMSAKCQFRKSPDGAQRSCYELWGRSSLLTLCFAHLGECCVTARFTETRTGPIEVVSQYKIEVGVTHWNGHC
jgi:hypothetical protein